MGAPDIPLEEKMITIAYGTDMVNINFVNFAANSREVARVSVLTFPYQCPHTNVFKTMIQKSLAS